MRTLTPYIDIHTHQHTVDEEVLFIYNNGMGPLHAANRFISAGIHPWHIHENNAATELDLLRERAGLSNVLAIGECGLDRMASAPLPLQEELFVEQIRIAEMVGKPLIIHCVRSFDILIRLKKETKATIPFIVHGYNNNAQIAGELLKNNFLLSFGKALLIPGSNAQKTILTVSPEQFFLETDDDALSIKSIFEEAAGLRKMSIEQLKERMKLNFKLYFTHE